MLKPALRLVTPVFAAATCLVMASLAQGRDFNASSAQIILPFNPDAPLRLSPPQSKHVLVVGGGLAGLSASLELAERGYKVTLREAEAVLGGKLSTRDLETSVGSFRVEHGLHMWFNNYHMFRDIRNRLNINENFRDYKDIHFIYRNYYPETLASSPPVYPLNLINLILKSPNLNMLDAVREIRMAADIVFFNHKKHVTQFDHLTFREWARMRGIHPRFFDVLLYPAATVTLNDPESISAAEMILYMHYFFIGQPRAMDREITTVDHATAVIDPWAARLQKLGVNITLNHWVRGLTFANGRAVGEVGYPDEYDAVILATGVPGARSILLNSTVADLPSDQALQALRKTVLPLKVAPHYKIVRAWFDRPTNSQNPDVIETPEHHPITLAAQFHRLEKESATWAQQTNGSIVEFHLYNIPGWENLTDDEVWNSIAPTVAEILPELAGAAPIAMTIGSYDNFTSFEVGQATRRPHAHTPRELGVPNLFFAGDWISTDYPSALMERAVATGREAANAILIRDGVRQAPLQVTSSRGPGILPR